MGSNRCFSHPYSLRQPCGMLKITESSEDCEGQDEGCFYQRFYQKDVAVLKCEIWVYTTWNSQGSIFV